MKTITDQDGNVFGPFYEVVVQEDGLFCNGGVVLPFSVIGTYTENDYVAPVPTYTAEELAPLKAAKDESINVARAVANSSYFVHQGKSVAVDPLSRSDIDGVNGEVVLNGTFPAGFPGVWKAMDGTYISLATVADWKAFYSSMTSTGLANFGKAQQLKAALEAATTPDEIAAIGW